MSNMFSVSCWKCGEEALDPVTVNGVTYHKSCAPSISKDPPPRDPPWAQDFIRCNNCGHVGKAHDQNPGLPTGACLVHACGCTAYEVTIPPSPPPQGASISPSPVKPPEIVDHPSHYGGKDNLYEHVKVVNAWGLNYQLGNATKYIARAGKKPGVPAEQDLLKARKFIDLELERIKPNSMQPVIDAMDTMIAGLKKFDVTANDEKTMETWSLDRITKQKPLSDSSFMSYSQAMKKVLEGKHVRRPCWRKGDYLFLYEVYRDHSKFVHQMTQTGPKPYTANVESMTARDWYVYEPETTSGGTPESTKDGPK